MVWNLVLHDWLHLKIFLFVTGPKNGDHVSQAKMGIDLSMGPVPCVRRYFYFNSNQLSLVNDNAINSNSETWDCLPGEV